MLETVPKVSFQCFFGTEKECRLVEFLKINLFKGDVLCSGNGQEGEHLKEMLLASRRI